MPKTIKKRMPKVKPLQEGEIKSGALHALDEIRKKQSQLITAVSAAAVLIVIYIIFAVYSSSKTEEAYAIETEAYNYYYATDKDASMTEEARMKKAVELYKKSIDIKASPTALFYLGNAFFKLGNYDSAIKEYTAFTTKYRSHAMMPVVYQKLVSAYFNAGKNEQALETIKKLTLTEGGIFKDTALVLEARHLDRSGQTEKALEKYRELVTEFPASPWIGEAGSKVSTAEAKKAAPVTEASNDQSGQAEKKPENPSEK